MVSITIQKKLLLSDMVAESNIVPPTYIRPESERPDLDQVIPSTDHPIPIIDIQALLGPSRPLILRDIAHACRNYGFFQVKNHGIPNEVVGRMLRTGKEFFKLSEMDRMENYSEDPMKATRLSTSFNLKAEKVLSWRDYLRLHCHPLEDYVHDWPSNPPTFREDASEYCRNTRGLILKLLEAISESLGLEKEHIGKALGNHGQHMAINYYPPCPQPELTYGLPAHTDPNALTLLLQEDVAGLQVLKDGKWLAVSPIPNTFVVNIGDQIQVISNDMYKSVLHRVIVNSDKDRISIPTFYCPSPDAVIEPACPKKDGDESELPLYRKYTYGEYYTKFWARGLKKESCLDMFSLNNVTHEIDTSVVG